ncbi:MAG: lipid A deacylase LpxR family protein [Pedobacter sp.]|nr:MAG: lipid A deacylase LpxR family protein [Pedobacter sp.]
MYTRFISKFYLLPCLFIFLSVFSFAQNYQSEVNLKLDNDFYIAFKQDRYYTHGTFVEYKHALNLDTNRSSYTKKILALELGQKIYNPYWSNAPDVNLHDRPFAGYAYIGGGIRWIKKNETQIRGNIQVGIIGPGSFAEEVQTGFHKLLNAYYPVSGWDYQVKNELILNFELEYLRKAYKSTNSPFDIHYIGNVQLGNFNTALQAGAVFRFGKFNPLESSSLFNTRISKNGIRTKPEIFFYYQPQLQATIFDASIQGGLLRSDKGPVTFKPKTLVFQQVLGLNAAYQRLGFKYLVTFKTKEVNSNAHSYYYGSFILSYLFGKS